MLVILRVLLIVGVFVVSLVSACSCLSICVLLLGFPPVFVCCCVIVLSLCVLLSVHRVCFFCMSREPVVVCFMLCCCVVSVVSVFLFLFDILVCGIVAFYHMCFGSFRVLFFLVRV